MNTNDTDSIARAFVDELDLSGQVANTCSAIWLRATGALGGGLALTALLAALFHH